MRRASARTSSRPRCPPVFGRRPCFATAFTTVAGQKNTGFMVGMSMPLGDTVTASTAVSGGSSGSSIECRRHKAARGKAGQLRLARSATARAVLGAAVGRRLPIGRRSCARKSASTRTSKGAVATAEIEGSVATLGGGVFFANRIDDAFAVVETGVPGIEVFHENRSVGVTNSAGRALDSRAAVLSEQQDRHRHDQFAGRRRCRNDAKAGLLRRIVRACD